eukprot:m.163891 g.163891  ORF g.163891 m.163891 type:complete len:173 (-) comp16564_c0_seq1:3274-3792(-)
MGLWNVLMSVLDGSVFVTMPEEQTAPPPPATDEQPPDYNSPSSSSSELHSRLARAAGNAEVQQLVHAYINSPSSQALTSLEVVDIVLKFATEDADKVALCSIFGSAPVNRNVYPPSTAVAIVKALSQPSMKVQALIQLKPALAINTYDDQMVLLELFEAGSPERQQVEQMLA